MALKVLLSHGDYTQADVLLRVYKNQDPDGDLENEYFCFEVMNRDDLPYENRTTLSGRYAAKHPQGVQLMAERLVDDLTDLPGDVTLVLSNEFEGVNLTYLNWFDDAFNAIIRGERKYDYHRAKHS